MFRQFALMALLILSLASFTLSQTEARSLSDLLRRPAQLYLPSQIIPGHPATVTLKGRPGQTYLILMSSTGEGRTLENGMPLRVGNANTKKTGIIPESGLAEITFTVPEKIEGKEYQYLEAVVWTQPDQSDAQLVEIINSGGIVDGMNHVYVGKVADPGNTLLVPGDPNLSGLFRSLETMNAVKNDPRKKLLVDDGMINKDRQIDRNLNNATPASTVGF